MSVAECRWHATLFVVCLSFLCVRGYLQYWIALGSCVCMFLFCSPFAIRYYCCLFSPIFLSITRVYFCHILPQLIFPFDIFFFFFFFFNSCCSLVLLAFHLSDLCIYYSLPFVCAHCYLHIILYGSLSIFLLFCFFFHFFILYFSRRWLCIFNSSLHIVLVSFSVSINFCVVVVLVLCPISQSWSLVLYLTPSILCILCSGSFYLTESIVVVGFYYCYAPIFI